MGRPAFSQGAAPAPKRLPRRGAYRPGVPEPRAPDPDLPADVRAAIARRCGLVADDTRRILSAAAVLGRTFEPAVLVTLTRLPPAAVDAALADGEACELVRAEADGRYTFVHALVEATLYDALGPTRRARLHRAAAEALERLHPSHPPLAAIAHHCCSSVPLTEPDRAAAYAQRAGREAGERGAWEQAVGHFRRALDAARTGGACCLDARGEATLLRDLGLATLRTGRPDEAEEVLRLAVERAREAGDPALTADAALGLGGGQEESIGFRLLQTDPTLVVLLEDVLSALPDHELARRALVTARLAGLHFDAGNGDRARDLGTEALDLAGRSGDPDAVAVALATRHQSLSGFDGLAERLALDARLDESGIAPTLQSQVWRIGDLLEAGRVPDADRAATELEAGPLASAHARSRWYAAHYRAMRSLMVGDLDEAERHAAEAAGLGARLAARTVGVSGALQSLFIARERDRLAGVHELLDDLAARHPMQPGLAVAAAWVRLHNGLLDEAREQLAPLAAGDFAALPRGATWTAAVTMLADLYAGLGGRRESDVLYRQALAARGHFVVVPRIVVFLGSMEQTLGNLAVTAGRLDAAVEHLDAARAAHALLEAPLLVARTDLARARLLRLRGEPDEADALLADVAAEAHGAGWAAVAREATALRPGPG